MSAPLVCAALCLIALGVTLICALKGYQVGRYASKPLASLCFILVAVTGGALTGDSAEYGRIITLGLALGAVGDVALMLAGRRSFLVGLVAFLLGHIAYVVAFAAVTPVSAWSGPWALVPIGAAAVVVRWLWPHLSGPVRGLRVPVLCYVLVITVMAVAALAVLFDDARAHLSDRRAALACAGALLFFASDLAVARQRFVKESIYNRLWGLPAYYLGQLFIAFSALS